MPSILIVEDEKTIADILVFNLKREGFETAVAYDGPTGLQKALAGGYDLILLDVMLPGLDGFEILRSLREKSDVPVIMVTAREEERDKILGLETGADDYVTKPFSVKELSARIRANMRRTAGGGVRGEGDRVHFGPFVVDRGLHTVTKNGAQLELTQREYDILSYFLSQPVRVVGREELMEKVWGFDYYGDLRAIDVAMRRLREKLEDDPAEPEYILTKRGQGYYLKR